MPVNIDRIEVEATGTQQFQADHSFKQDQPAAAASITVGQEEPLFDAADISLVMRQFFQSPSRSAG